MSEKVISFEEHVQQMEVLNQRHQIEKEDMRAKYNEIIKSLVLALIIAFGCWVTSIFFMSWTERTGIEYYFGTDYSNSVPSVENNNTNTNNLGGNE